MPKPQAPTPPVASNPADLLGSELDKLPPPAEGLVSTALKISPAHITAKQQRIQELGHGLDPWDQHHWLNAADTLHPDDVAQMRKADVVPFVDHYLQTLNSVGGQSLMDLAKAGGLKRGWYRNFSKALFQMFPSHDDAHRFAAILAATSPQTGVERNLPHALDIWAEWNRDGRPTKSLKPWLQKIFKRWETQGKNVQVGDKMLPQGDNPTFGAYGPNIIRALLNTDPDWTKFSFLTKGNPKEGTGQGFGKGFKVTSFFHNLTGHQDPVTLDSWMAKLFGQNAKNYSSRILYRATQAAVHSVANKMNETLGPGERPWTPAEVQETSWSVLKGVSEAAIDKPLHEVIATMSQGDMSNVVDFVSLMVKDNGIRERLKALGMGEGLDKLSTVFNRVQEQTASKAGERAFAGHEDILERIGEIINKGAKQAALKKAIAKRKRLAASERYTPVMAQLIGDAVA